MENARSNLTLGVGNARSSDLDFPLLYVLLSVLASHWFTGLASLLNPQRGLLTCIVPNHDHKVFIRPSGIKSKNPKTFTPAQHAIATRRAISKGGMVARQTLSLMADSSQLWHLQETSCPTRKEQPGKLLLAAWCARTRRTQVRFARKAYQK